ncbi:MAG: DUF4197 domain-containing protein [Gallionella sp.]
MKLHPLSFIPLLALCASAHAFDFSGLKDKLSRFEHPPTVTPATSPPADKALARFSKQDQVGSLKQALLQGVKTAVNRLARKNGYLGNDKVRIPLPESLKKVNKLLRQFGMGNYAKELTTAMNRAAEAAVPEAKTLLVRAIKKMTVKDAKEILMGNNDAATQYFRKNTEAALTGQFKPIVSHAMQNVKLAQKYDQFASKGVKFGLVKQKNAQLDDYITRKALDGLFLMMAEQEKAIRTHPLQATGRLAKKIFSAIKF